MTRNSTLLGIACLIGGVSVFSVQDLILKLISGAYPLYEAMTIRGLTSTPLLLLFVWMEGGRASLFNPGTGQMILRGCVMFLAYFTFYIALAGLPLPTTVALYYSAPLFITLLSVGFLGERVGLPGWLAVIGGFGGVVIMLHPGTALFSWTALLPVASGLTYALSMIAARRMGTRHSASALAFWGNSVFLICALIMAAVLHDGSFADESGPSIGFLTRGWINPSLTDLGLMMTCGVVAAVGLWLLTQAYRLAAASTVAPFEYTGLAWSVLWGWTFWRDWPDTQGWIGITIIAGAGLFVLWQERQRVADPGRVAQPDELPAPPRSGS
jgi:drug/metabolite transporter (DMT)-like permease